MTRAAYALATLLGLALGTALAGCPQPIPPVPPGPSPADPFAGAVIDCAAPEVEQGLVRVDAAARACLVGVATSVCLAELYPTETINTIACSVREQGVAASIRVLGDDAHGEDSTVNNAARAWIQAERIGYR